MQLPLETRKIRPHPSAQKLGATYRADGLPDGVHTGGVWRYRGEIWKPLDGRPYANADFVCPTLEDVALDELDDLYSFPHNWRVEDRNGRRWLVRKEALVLSESDYCALDKRIVLQIEHDIREANQRGWEINDAFQIAYDWDLARHFVLDLSSAHKMTAKTGAYAADEFDRINRFFKLCGLDSLAALRKNARHLLSPLEFEYKHPEAQDGDYRHVYASLDQAFCLTGADLRQDCILEHQKRADGVPYTWIVTEQPLSHSAIERLGLTWAYSRLERNV